MPRKRRSSVNEKCRVCLKDDGCMSDIFADGLRPKINDLAECASIHINVDDNRPRNICHVCLYKLDMWIDFKEQFMRSDALLREHLELGDVSDNALSTAKRKRSELQEGSIDKQNEQDNTKKVKCEEPICISVSSDAETDETKPFPGNESIRAEESIRKKTVGKITAGDSNEISENASDPRPQNASVSSNTRQTLGRRGKTTERRKASTKRWAARKKALLAATGENDTDTDSMSSEDSQLSPVRKARAKCNVEKVAESQRGISRSRSNSDSDVSQRGGSEDRTFGDYDDEKPKPSIVEKLENAPTNGTDRMDEGIAEDSALAQKRSKTADDFAPNSVRSELIINEATYVVTSTLVLSDPREPSVQQNLASELDTNRERNTDIIDAVQLRRVSPKFPEKRDKKFVESCLSIEVEGTELESLRRVQTDLAKFVEVDMKRKFTLHPRSRENHDSARDSLPTLDRQLRTIVEKAITKNLEDTRNIADNRGDNTFTSDFVRAALRSNIFQPRLMLHRLDARKLREIAKKSSNGRVDAKIEKKSSIGSISTSRGKRRSVQPLKYADFETSPIDSELEESREANAIENEPNQQPTKSSPGPKSSKVKTYGPAAAKQLLPVATNRATNKSKNLSHFPKSSPSTGENSSRISGSTSQNSSRISAPIEDESIGEKHICGVCGDPFNSRSEVETHHFSTHRNTSIPGKQAKRKLMRCMKCQEIVEARFVKSHVCLSLRSLYKCYSCNSSFKTEKLLTSHLASHSIDDRDGKIDMAPRKETKTRTTVERLVEEIETRDGSTNNRSSSRTTSTRDSYTCFVCDKIFTDEEVLKDHLQMHCDDMSDDERSNGKDYQCAICGESLDSEDALETHVEKHLFDDEDDNPNLISISGVNDNDKTSIVKTVRCGQCDEKFDSEMLLMLHMQAHDEEIAIAEWERRGIDSAQQHICVICDDVFATEIELTDHLDIHNGNAHICQLCDRPFLTLEELQAHVNTH